MLSEGAGTPWSEPPTCGRRPPEKRETAVTKKGGRKIGRDAKTGEFIPVKQAQKRPKTTVVETVYPNRKGK
jgi:hypothetical protein